MSYNGGFGGCGDVIKKMKASSSPFLIGVAGGTASGKVLLYIILKLIILGVIFLENTIIYSIL